MRSNVKNVGTVLTKAFQRLSVMLVSAAYAHPVASTSCCPFRVRFAPNRGKSGWPPSSILGEYAQDGIGGFKCISGCENDIGKSIWLQLADDSFMNGTRWAWTTSDNEYIGFSVEYTDCPTDAALWNLYYQNRYVIGSVTMQCTEQARAEPCCDELVVTRAPPLLSAGDKGVVGTYSWVDGAFECAQCAPQINAPVVLKLVAAELMPWIDGQSSHWSFVLQGSYTAYALHDASCPDHIGAWHYWVPHVGYRVTTISLQCANHDKVEL